MVPNTTHKIAGSQPQMTATAGPRMGPQAGYAGVVVPKEDLWGSGYVVNTIVSGVGGGGKAFS